MSWNTLPKSRLFYVLWTSKGGNIAFLPHPLRTMLGPCSSYLQKTTNTPTLNGGDGGGVRILLFSEVALFMYNVSTILSPIVVYWLRCQSVAYHFKLLLCDTRLTRLAHSALFSTYSAPGISEMKRPMFHHSTSGIIFKMGDKQKRIQCFNSFQKWLYKWKKNRELSNCWLVWAKSF